MDDCLAQVAIDFGGRNWLVWDRIQTRNGRKNADRDLHFFKSFLEAKQNHKTHIHDRSFRCRKWQNAIQNDFAIKGML
jgi:imidazoleglycerol phosphate dehydratase HisB